MNGESVDLWREYVKMEMGFVESLRRRWGVLGLKISENSGEKDISQDVEMGGMDGKTSLNEALGLPAEEESDEQARKEILNGALVKTVISSAVKGMSNGFSLSCPPSYNVQQLSLLSNCST